MISELAKIIVDEVYSKLDEIYNHRKDKEGLISCQNTLINSLKKEINQWYELQVGFDKRMQEFIDQDGER